jgi:hypothetical protein
MGKRPYRCSDGFCGADDCARCRPNTWWQDEAYEDACSKADDDYNERERDEDSCY